MATSLVRSSPDSSFIFLIDTSRSMYYSLRAIKKVVIDALYDLLEKPNSFFNVMAFNTKIIPWADRCVPCIPVNVANAAYWVSQLREVTHMECNHLEAIFRALDDKKSDSLFFCSNSRPVQKVENVIRNAVDAAYGRPINTIYPATVMSNKAGKAFMHDLALASGGCFYTVKIDDFGNFIQSSLIFQAERLERKPPFPCKLCPLAEPAPAENKKNGSPSETDSNISDREKNGDDDCVYNALDYAGDYSRIKTSYGMEVVKGGLGKFGDIDKLTRESLFGWIKHIPARTILVPRPAPWNL